MKDLFDDMHTAADSTGTTSNIDEARSFLNNKSYHNFTVGSAVNYSFFNSGVWDALNDGPTYIQGHASTPTGTAGHAWVVDCAAYTKTHYYEQTTYIYHSGLIVEGPVVWLGDVISQKMVRYNWGRQWFSIGWFAEGIFQPENSSYNFNSNVKIISSIK